MRGLPQPGDRVGPYRCEGLLAQGGMGAVFAARHEELDRPVALKLVLAPDDPGLRARFLREVEACGRLNHPHVVRVHDSGEAGGRLYLAMELIRGESLQARLAREGPLEPRLAARLIQEAAAGIAHAHAAGVLHRDLKPGNLLWDETLQATRVVDFGLARHLGGADSLTATGEVLGTLGFLAPEQALGEEVGPSADVYGLGATLFALVAGRPPFERLGLVGLAAVTQNQAPDLRSLAPKVEPALAGIVARALAQAPSERQPSAEALGEELRRYLAGERVAGGPGRRRGALALGLTLLLGAGAGATGLRWQGARAAERSLGEFEAWRRARLEPFAYGWGAAPAGLADELSSWEERLAEARSRAPAAAWGEAWAEVQAQRWLLAAEAEAPAARGLPEPPAGDSGSIALAALACRRGEIAAAREALAKVFGPGRARRGYRLTFLALRAEAEPAAFLEGLASLSPEERPAGLALFPRALRSAGATSDPGPWVGWVARAEALGAPAAGEALRAALEATAPRWGKLLSGLDPEHQAQLLRTLCGPLRERGLWPGPAFAQSARAPFQELAEGAVAADLATRPLLLLEHELFYRVEPTPPRVPGWAVAMHASWVPSATHRGGEEPALVRASLRCGILPGGLSSRARIEGAIELLAPTREPQSRLERLLSWLLRLSIAQREVPPGASRRELAELRAILAFGVDDVSPRVLATALGWVRQLIVLDPEREAASATFLEAAAWGAFEAALAEQRDSPIGTELLESCALALTAPFEAWLALGESDRAFACFERSLPALEAALAQASERPRREELEALRARVYGMSAEICRAHGLSRVGLPALAPGLPFVRRDGTLSVRAGYAAWLLAAWRETGELPQALALVDELAAEPERTHAGVSKEAALVLEGSGRAREGLAWLLRSRADMASREGQPGPDAVLRAFDVWIAELRARHPELGE